MKSTSWAIGLLVGLSLAGGAFAQSIGAPAGREPATAPGGTEGLAGPANERQAIEDGTAIPAPPSVGIPVETAPGKPPEKPHGTHHHNR